MIDFQVIKGSSFERYYCMSYFLLLSTRKKIICRLAGGEKRMPSVQGNCLSCVNPLWLRGNVQQAVCYVDVYSLDKCFL